MSNPMSALMNMMNNKQNNYPPINPQMLMQFMPKLTQNDLVKVVQQARAQGISESDIEAGLNFLLQYK